MQRSLEELRQSIIILPIPAIVTDPMVDDNPIVAANDAFLKMTGFERAHVIGRNCRFLAGPATEPEAQAAIRDAVHNGRIIFTEITNYRADGRPFRNGLTITPVTDKGGSPRFFLGTQADLSHSIEPVGDRLSRSQRLVATLSPRLIQVLHLMAAGLRNQEIANELRISIKTVKMHRKRLVDLFNVRTSAQVIRIAVEADLALSVSARVQIAR